MRDTATRGFTLIEILVVVSIAGIMAAMVVISGTGSDGSRQIERESRRLAMLLELARDETLLRGEQWGLDVTADDYGFLRFDDDSRTWQEVSDAPFQRRPFPQGVRVRVDLDRRHVLTLRADPLSPAMRSLIMPEVLIYTTGELSNFVLDISDDQERSRWRVASDGLQSVTVARADH